MSDGIRIAWIVGGSSGIGLAAAQALATSGVHVVLAARDEVALAQASEGIARNGGLVDYVVMDATERSQVEEARDTILARHGRIAVLVNSAGFNVPRRQWHNLDPREFDEVLSGNLTTSFNTIHAVLPQMREQRDGVIINVASGAGKAVTVGAGVAYTAAKHALVVLTQSINLAEFRNGIRACAVSPGETATPIMSKRAEPLSRDVLDRMLQPEDVGDAISFVARMPPHAAIYELVMSPTFNRAWL